MAGSFSGMQLFPSGLAPRGDGYPLMALTAGIRGTRHFSSLK